ncbi:MAG: PhoH family protein [Alphaproteobacteria bacterium]|nr:PhoH family protein [Alphaproteobacteria bacterium]
MGENNANLSRIEKLMGVSISSRGNTISIQGDDQKIVIAREVLVSLYRTLQRHQTISLKEVEAMVRLTMEISTSDTSETLTNEPVLTTRKRQIRHYTEQQRKYISELRTKDMVFATGPAGTGKTYLAVAVAVALLLKHEVERIVLSRPAVEAGEKLGFLPGDLRDKIDPYLQPLYDALHDMLGADDIARYLEKGMIEIAPLAFMRGRTLTRSIVILDEAQNTTPTQMKMFLTRLGEGSKMVVVGDLSQVDLERGITSGLRDAVERLKHLDEIGVVEFSEKDIIRHPLLTKIIRAYDK